ncbi:hypothetical protein N5079_21305 [Planotetraspora sp. A-T 1434]|uniref:hypothetical protein n=1 Tax=Planotetraspora sp. A-T 1434 TaxID=2979219 RepID=UPI0021C10D39|nr:hypothetical protein [Planotetraspora sp. A-T 1434]MCT9932745.1 hypothetical protein [Planotetraspora sp. A-T 1434]
MTGMTGMTGMSLLEERYRRVLRLLPASYRTAREDEMVSAFLEGSEGVMDDDNPRPRWSEIASVAALSVRVRLGGIGAAPRFYAWGETVRLVALLGLAFQAALGCATLGSELQGYGLLGPAHPDYSAFLGDPGSGERLWHVMRLASDLLGPAAFVALALGRVRIAKAAALLGLASAVYDVASALAPLDVMLRSMAPSLLMLLVPVLALLAGFHRDAPVARHPLWAAAVPLVAGCLLYGMLTVLASMSLAPLIDVRVWPWIWPWMAPAGLACLALLLASVAWAGRARRAGRAGRRPSVPLALAILIVPVLLAMAASLNLGAVDPFSRTMTVVIIAQLAALVVCGIALIVAGVRALPPADAPAAGGIAMPDPAT